jgi:hypothetical protein
MASESAVQALSPAVTSFVICGRTWKLGYPIHSTGVGAIENKMVQSFGDAFGAQPESKESRWDAVPVRNIV